MIEEREVSVPAKIDQVVRSGLARSSALTDLEVLDVELGAGLLRVTVDRAGGVDLDTLAQANRAVAAGVEELDGVARRFAVEVSSPGIERVLRTPAHFARFLGSPISVKTHPGVPGARRFTATLLEADDAGVTLGGAGLEARRLAYAEIQVARTVFEWDSSECGRTGAGRFSSARPNRTVRGRAGKP